MHPSDFVVPAVVAAAGTLLIVLMWSSAQSFVAATSDRSYCEVDGEQASYVWDVQGLERIQLVVGPDSCTVASTPTGDVVLPSGAAVSLTGATVDDAEVHEPAAILDSPGLTLMRAASVEVIGVLITGAIGCMVFLSWLRR